MHFNRFITAAGLLLALEVATASIASGVVIHVEADGSGDVPTIAAAYAIAVYADSISLGNGIFYEHDVVMKPGVDLVSKTRDPNQTIVDAQTLGRCFVVESESNGGLIEGITFRNGLSIYEGGLLNLGASAMHFRKCVFQDGSASGGGAIAVYASSNFDPTFIECSFVSNESSGEGGAIWSNGGGGWIALCELRNNSAGGHGGAIYSQRNDEFLAMEGCTFEENAAGGDGGAVSMEFNSFEVGTSIYRCTFVRNVANRNGGACNLGRADRIESCVFVENEAARMGGGVFFAAAVVDPKMKDSAYLSYNLFARNSAGTQGGAFAYVGVELPITIGYSTFVLNGAPSGGHLWSDPQLGFPSYALRLGRCILAYSSSGGAVGGSDLTGPDDVRLGCCDVFGNAGGDYVGPLEGQDSELNNFSADPLFCDLAGGDYTLQENSPCAPPQSGTCGQVGVFGVGCGAVHVESKSWGAIKALYR